MADDNGKIVLPKWLLILIITAVIIPMGKTAWSLFVDNQDDKIQHIQTEMWRIEKENKERWEKIDERTLKLIQITERLDERTGGRK